MAQEPHELVLMLDSEVDEGTSRPQRNQRTITGIFEREARAFIALRREWSLKLAKAVADTFTSTSAPYRCDGVRAGYGWRCPALNTVCDFHCLSMRKQQIYRWIAAASTRTMSCSYRIPVL